MRGQIVGEEYILLSSSDVEGVVRKIVQTTPDVILNTINGDTNLAFFRELRKAGITPDKTPTMSFSIAEDELRSMNAENMVGDYASWNYFQSIDSAVNRSFVQRFKQEYGTNRVTDDPMEAGYFGVLLWAKAVQEARSDNVEAVRKAMSDQSLEAPGGMVYVDAENNHTWKTVRIGRITEGGQFDIIWNSEKPVRPVPYPVYRSKTQWEKFLRDLYEGWDQNWANEGSPESLTKAK